LRPVVQRRLRDLQTFFSNDLNVAEGIEAVHLDVVGPAPNTPSAVRR
jgi:hypothetical protein